MPRFSRLLIVSPRAQKDRQLIKMGILYAVNFAKEGTIGKIMPDGKGEIFIELPDGSVGNGIRFNQAWGHVHC